MQEIQLTLSVDQTNYILNALGKQPFNEVADLIVLVRTQGEASLKPKEEVVTEEE